MSGASNGRSGRRCCAALAFAPWLIWPRGKAICCAISQATMTPCACPEDANRSRWPLHPLWVDLQKQVDKFQGLGEHREVDPQAAIEERLARIGGERLWVPEAGRRALTGAQRAEESVSLWSAFERLRNLVLQVHHPVSWKLDVKARRDELRVGGG